MIEMLRRYWFLVAIIGFMLTFSGRLTSVWAMPQAVNELSKQVSEYIAAQEESQKRQDQLIELLVKKEMGQ